MQEFWKPLLKLLLFGNFYVGCYKTHQYQVDEEIFLGIKTTSKQLNETGCWRGLSIIYFRTRADDGLEIAVLY